MTVDTYQPSNGLAVPTVGTGGIAVQSAHVMASWAQAANDAHRFVMPLIRTDFMPAHFRPKGNSDEAYALAVASATAAVLYGLEVGLSPLQALQGTYVIQGRPTMYAGTMVAILQSKGHEIWTEDLTDSRAVVCGQRQGSSRVERAVFTMQRASTAGYVSKNQKYKTDPQAMLLARAQSDCCKRVARDALLGIAYSVEEMWDEQGDGQPAPAKRTVKRAPARAALTAPATPDAASPAPPPAVAQEGPPLPGEEEQAAEPAAPSLITDPQMAKMHASFNDVGITERDDRLAYAAQVIGRDVTTSKELTVGEASAVIEALVADAAGEPRDDGAPPLPSDEPDGGNA